MTMRCRECGGTLQTIGANGIGRPVYRCQNGHRQVGPFATRQALITDGGDHD